MPESQNISNLIPRRQYMQMLRNLKDQNIIKVITGVRRCGKSTLLEMYAGELLHKGMEQAQIQFLNFEDPDIYSIGNWKDIYDYVKVRLLPDKMNYVFLDEVQNIDTFERLVDGLFIKKNVDLYITGSNAWLLSSELATLLTGRYIGINILPLYFNEFQKFINIYSQNFQKTESFGNIEFQNTEYQNNIYSKSQNLSKQELLAIFCTEGGIPEYFKQKSISQKQADEFVRSVLNTIVEKDIFTRLNVRDKHEFNKTIDFVFDSVGSFVSPNSISNTLRTYGTAVDNKTVAKYLDALCDAFLLYKVQKDISHWLENMVYFELLHRNKEVYVGKINNLEVDFVVTDNEGYTSYYQVAWTTMQPETLERELASLKATLQPAQALGNPACRKAATPKKYNLFFIPPNIFQKNIHKFYNQTVATKVFSAYFSFLLDISRNILVTYLFYTIYKMRNSI